MGCLRCRCVVLYCLPSALLNYLSNIDILYTVYNVHCMCIIQIVVQLQRNGQSNTHIGQEVLIKRMTQNDSQFLLVGWTTNWLTYRRGSARTGYPLGRVLYRLAAYTLTYTYHTSLCGCSQYFSYQLGHNMACMLIRTREIYT